MKAFVRVLLVVVLAGVAFFVWRQKQAERLNADGVRMLEAGDYVGAQAKFEQARAKSGDARILKNLALAHEKQQHLKQAADAIDAAQRKKPDLKDGQEISDRVHGVIDREAALRESAARRIEKLKAEGREPDPASMDTVNKIVFTMMHMNDYDRAIFVLEAALLQYPENYAIEARIEDIEAKRDREAAAK